jgi:hypothetical protein
MNEMTQVSREVDTEDNPPLIDSLRGIRATQSITKREGILSSYTLCKELC